MNTEQINKLLWQAYIANQAYDLVLHGGTLEIQGEKFPVGGFSGYRERMDKHEKAMSSAKTVADLGAGTGILAMRLAKQGKRVYCIENNPFMMRDLELKATAEAEDIEAAGGEIIPLMQDVNNMEIPETVEGICSNNVLYLATVDPEQFFSRSQNTLRQGGMFVISSFVDDPDLEAILTKGLAEGKARKTRLPDGTVKDDTELLQHQIQIIIATNEVIFANGLMKNTYQPDAMIAELKRYGFSPETIEIDYVEQGFTAHAIKQ